MKTPQTTRIQFSACGACRARRVKCDLKDKCTQAVLEAGLPVSCSNCEERNFTCKYEFAQSKATKMLRRGRRLKQVEAVYGQSSPSNLGLLLPMPPSFSLDGDSLPDHASITNTSIIPPLTHQFFSSDFWKRFSIQRPILDVHEFSTKYFKPCPHSHLSSESTPLRRSPHSASSSPTHATSSHTTYTHSCTCIPPTTLLIAKILVVWARCFGIDEAGDEIPGFEFVDMDDQVEDLDLSFGQIHESVRRREDGVVKVEWDEYAEPDASFARPKLSSSASSSSSSTTTAAAATTRQQLVGMISEILHMIDMHGVLRCPTWDGMRALLLLDGLSLHLQPHMNRRVMHEATMSQVNILCTLSPVNAVSNGIEDFVDPITRARTFWYAHYTEGITYSVRGERVVLSSDDLVIFQRALPPNIFSSISPNEQSTGMEGPYDIPLRIGNAWRSLNDTFSHLRRQPSGASFEGCVDDIAFQEIWDDLDKCWRDLGVNGAGRSEELTSGWKIFIFECYNVIRESLKQRAAATSRLGSDCDSPASFHSNSSGSGTTQSPILALAEAKCKSKLPEIVSIIERLVDTNFFAYDGFMAHGGVYSAASLIAEGAYPTFEEDKKTFELCLNALKQIRWAFWKTAEKEESLRTKWSERETLRTTTHCSPPSIVTPAFFIGSGVWTCGDATKLQSAESPPQHYPSHLSPLAHTNNYNRQQRKTRSASELGSSICSSPSPTLSIGSSSNLSSMGGRSFGSTVSVSPPLPPSRLTHTFTPTACHPLSASELGLQGTVKTSSNVNALHPTSLLPDATTTSLTDYGFSPAFDIDMNMNVNGTRSATVSPLPSYAMQTVSPNNISQMPGTAGLRDYGNPDAFLSPNESGAYQDNLSSNGFLNTAHVSSATMASLFESDSSPNLSTSYESRYSLPTGGYVSMGNVQYAQ